jgi:hypothetical protein
MKDIMVSIVKGSMIYTNTEEERETMCPVSCKGESFFILIAIVLCSKCESFVVLTCLVF